MERGAPALLRTHLERDLASVGDRALVAVLVCPPAARARFLLPRAPTRTARIGLYRLRPNNAWTVPLPLVRRSWQSCVSRDVKCWWHYVGVD